MSVDPKVIEVLKKKMRAENQEDSISKIFEVWLDEIDQGKKDINQEEKIKAIMKKMNVVDIFIEMLFLLYVQVVILISFNYNSI